MSWSDDDINTVTRLWADGLSATQITGHLSVKRTRNAVIGKLHRLGLTNASRGYYAPKASITGGDNARKRQRAAAPKPAPKKTVFAWLKSEPLPAEDTPPANLVSLVDLEDHKCRFPHGDPREPGFGFCGQQSVEGQSYCDRHLRLAYRPVWVKSREVVVPLAAKVFA